MEMFNVTVRLSCLAAPARTQEVSLIVDTDATLSWIPREVLEKLGAIPFRGYRSRLPMGVVSNVI